MARSSGNRNDPNTTKVVREFKKAITVKVSGIKAFSILICFGQALKALHGEVQNCLPLPIPIPFPR